MTEELDRALASVPARPPAPRPKKGRWVLAGIGVLALYGIARCGTALYGGYEEGKALGEAFHKKLDAGQCGDVWKSADPRFRAAVSEEALGKLCTRIATRLGKTTAAKVQGVQMNTNGEGTFVNIGFATTFEKGSADEAFRYVRVGAELKLLHYNIVSPQLAD